MQTLPDDPLDRAHPRAFIREVASYPYGPQFREALSANLALIAHTLVPRDELLGRLLSQRRSEALSAVSDIWLAAHFLRARLSVCRLACSGSRIPDFRVSGFVAVLGVHVDLQVEAKRPSPSRDGSGTAPLSTWDAPRDWPFVPGAFTESDFATVVGPHIRRARKQFTSVGHPVFAIDVSESRTFQRLMLTDTDIGSEASGVLGLRPGEGLLLYAVGLSQAELWGSRWLSIPAAA